MDTVRVIHDREGHTLTVWFGDPTKEAISSEDEHGVLVMKDDAGRIIGVEILDYAGLPKAVTLEQAAVHEPVDR